MEAFGINSDDVSVWEHSVDDLSTIDTIRHCSPVNPRMASAQLSDTPVCATHRRQLPSGQVSHLWTSCSGNRALQMFGRVRNNETSLDGALRVTLKLSNHIMSRAHVAQQAGRTAWSPKQCDPRSVDNSLRM